ncbi:MAG TPA: hypothetical protein VE591_00560 [Candidatus Acidoferrum sp.]|nr:hypothetical protein [Candidatus Acidoferrum sp.]
MAQIVAALATSHGPLLSTPPEMWHLRAQADRENPRHWYRGAAYDFPSLVERRAPGFATQATDDVKRERYERCQRAIAELARRFRAARADVAIIFGNDQREIYHEELTGAFTIFNGAEIPSIPFSEKMKAAMPPGVALAERGHTPPGGAVYRGAVGIADTIIASLLDSEFDVATSERIPLYDGEARGIPHAFGFVYRRIMEDAAPPSVPVFTNVGEGVNRPRLRRVLAFGHAMKAAIDALPADLRVVCIASGGLTHFCVDEELDAEILDAMQRGDEAALAAYPEEFFFGNTCEIKSWYALAACMNDCGRTMRMIDYVPCYRTEAGTGSAMGFAAWETA